MREGSSGRARRLIVLLAAVAGVVAAHALEYTAAHVGAAGRAHHLHVTGHGYWPGAVRLAAAAAVLAVGIAAGSGVRRALDGHRAPPGSSGPPLLLRLGPLALAQAGLFTVMEIGERAFASSDVSELVRTPWFAVGLALQVLVAAVAVAVLRLVATGAERVAARARRPRRTSPATAVRPRRVWWAPAGTAGAAAGCRGPPAPLVA